eukprot:4652227-Pyramimonas_sp.AAC.1
MVPQGCPHTRQAEHAERLSRYRSTWANIPPEATADRSEASSPLPKARLAHLLECVQEGEEGIITT